MTSPPRPAATCRPGPDAPDPSVTGLPPQTVSHRTGIPAYSAADVLRQLRANSFGRDAGAGNAETDPDPRKGTCETVEIRVLAPHVARALRQAAMNSFLAPPAL